MSPTTFAHTPDPPYYVAIFTSQRADEDPAYAETAARMAELAARQPGFLGMESVRDGGGFGITVSYWDSLDAIAAWKAHAEHRLAQAAGKQRWYSRYHLRVALVERSSEGGVMPASAE